MIIAGIDPSLTGTGIGILRDGICIDNARIGWPGRDGASDLDRVRRVVAVVQDVIKFIRPHNPDLIMIESPAYGQYLPSTCDRNFLWGALVHEFGEAQKLPYAGVTPTCRAQFATGKGHASKLMVINAVNGWWPHLNLRTEPVSRQQDNEADGITLATMGAARYESDLLPFTLREYQLNNLEAVPWPVIA